MGYENVDKNATYTTACENLKKIVNAIKKMRLKYYPNFTISPADQKTLDALLSNLETISTENGLDTLKETLMADVNDRYIPRSEEDNKGTQSLDNLLKACYGAIDAEKEALSYGKIKQARRCQIQLQKYLEIMESQKYLDATKLQNYGALIIEYKRRKFAELSIGRDKNDIKETKWTEILKGCYKAEDLQRRRAISEAIRNQMREGTVKQDLYKDDEIMQ